MSVSGPAPGVLELVIPVAPDTRLGAKLHTVDLAGPVILFFHGNGEIVSDGEAMEKAMGSDSIAFVKVASRGKIETFIFPLTVIPKTSVDNLMGKKNA